MSSYNSNISNSDKSLDELSTKYDINKPAEDKINKNGNYDLINISTISGIIHDLKSPIACSKSLFDMLENDIRAGENNETLLSDLSDLREINQELNELVHDLLDVNLSFETSLNSINLEYNINISDVCNRVIKLNKSFAITKSVNLEKNFDDNLIFSGIDTKILKQILTNLISNSIKYSNSNTTVTLAAKKIKNILEISVKDRGKGIAQEDLKKIFKKNIMLNPNSKEGDSHGLGLKIVDDLVKAMNGIIEVKSEIGVGSEFKVVFNEIVR